MAHVARGDTGRDRTPAFSSALWGIALGPLTKAGDTQPHTLGDVCEACHKLAALYLPHGRPRNTQIMQDSLFRNTLLSSRNARVSEPHYEARWPLGNRSQSNDRQNDRRCDVGCC